MGLEKCNVSPGSFYEVLLRPLSIFEYLATLTAPLVLARLIDAVIMVVNMDVETALEDPEAKIRLFYDFCVPAWNEQMRDDILGKYRSMLVKLFDHVYGDYAYRFDKAIYILLDDKLASTEDKDKAKKTLRDLFGESLFSEVMLFVKNIKNLHISQAMETAKKIKTILFQHIGEKMSHLLGEKGVVIRDTGVPLDMYRILWIPQGDNTASTGVYDLPGSKIQALSLLKNVLPGLIDYSTDENEFTRIAELAQKLNDADIDTLLALINKAYLHSNINITELVEATGKLFSQKRFIVYALLSFILTKKNGYQTYLDFEGKTPIVITYPKNAISKIEKL